MGALTGNVAGSINLTGGGGTDDYRELTHKPKINNVTLNDDLTSADLGIPETAVEDVKVDGMSVVTSGVANITLPDVPVQDVKVDGSSVVNAAGVANINLPSAPVQDVKVDGSSVVVGGIANVNIPVTDVHVDGSSVVDADGVANINIPAGVVLDVEVDGESVVTDGIAEITMPTVPEDLNDLSDVDITTPLDGDVLRYDSNSSKWINAVGGGGGSVTIDTVWTGNETPSTDGTVITLDETWSDYDILIFDIANGTSYYSTPFLFTHGVVVNRKYILSGFSYNRFDVVITFTGDTSAKIERPSSSGAAITYTKIYGIKF